MVFLHKFVVYVLYFMLCVWLYRDGKLFNSSHLSYLPLMGTGCSVLVNLVKYQTQQSQMLHEISACPRRYLGFHNSSFVIMPSVTIHPVFGGKCDLENLVGSAHKLLTFGSILHPALTVMANQCSMHQITDIAQEWVVHGSTAHIKSWLQGLSMSFNFTIYI